jgi:hypothetical protein
MELEKRSEFAEKEFERNDEDGGNNEKEIGTGENHTGDRCQSDLPPEYCQYRDEGCELAESCLSCPFARCIYDEPGGKQRWTKRMRDREIVWLRTNEGKTLNELAEMFSISPRTVQRVLKMAKGNGP